MYLPQLRPHLLLQTTTYQTAAVRKPTQKRSSSGANGVRGTDPDAGGKWPEESEEIRTGIPAVMKYAILAMICALAFFIRLFAVVRFFMCCFFRGGGGVDRVSLFFVFCEGREGDTHRGWEGTGREGGANIEIRDKSYT